ncbi:MAG: MFS transporter [Pseudomonadota bacterium]|nr:MFS transporter [Pseudomonadota bacterium]
MTNIAGAPKPNNATSSVILALGLAVAAIPLNSTMIGVALPLIGAQLQATPTDTTQALMASYLIATIVLQTPGGKLGDLWGRKRALYAGQLLFITGALVGSLAPTLLGLTAARLVMAAGGALLLPAALATLRNLVAPQQRGRMFGILGAAMGASAALGPPLGGWLAEAFGWEAVFWINIPLLLTALLLGGGLPAERPSDRPPLGGIDWRGGLLLAATLLAIIGAIRGSGISILILSGSSVVLLVLFIAHELRQADPLLDVRIFRTPAYSCGVAITAIQNFGLYGPVFFLPFVMFDGYGIGPGVTGQTVLFMTGGMVLFGPAGGRLADRFGARRMVTLAAGVATVGMLGIALAPDWRHPASLMPWLLLVGMGMACSTGPAQAAAMSAVTAQDSGMAAGALTMLRYLGSILGISLVALVAQSANGHLPDVARAGFLSYAAAYAITALVARGLPRRGVAGDDAGGAA